MNVCTYRMARLDGMITLASMTGTLLSPYVFMHLGYYGNFISSSLLFSSASAYLFFFVHEPVQKQNGKNEMSIETDTSSCLLVKLHIRKILTISVVIPLLEMKKFILKERRAIMKVIIILQCSCFCIYTFSGQANRLTYLYMLLVYDEFTATDYAHMNIAMDLLRASIMLIAMPIISGKFQLHDALLLSIFAAFEVVGAMIKPFANTLWLFCLACGIGTVGSCKFTMVWCLISKTVGNDEVGKIFSVI